MSRWLGHHRTRRACALLAGALLATGAACDAAPAALADTQPASPSAVKAGLGVGAIPAEIVILVDISLSMSTKQHGLYPEVLQQLPAFLNALAQQEPQDTVGVIVFGNPVDTQLIYLGHPTSNIPLPGDATSDGTDFGVAFAQAINLLSQAPSSIQVGGVLLLSDGMPYAPNDKLYGGGNGFEAAGWKALRAKVQALPMTVTGYDLPLTTKKTAIDDQNQALAAVFSQRETLSDGADLGKELGVAQQNILDSKIANAAGPDSHQGVRVAWSGLPGTDGKPLNLSPGHAAVRLTLTATTRRIPLDLTGLSVRSTGLPVTMTGTLPSSDQALKPGQSVTVPVRLTWQPGSSGFSAAGGMRTVHGRLMLTSQVSSPYTKAIKYTFDDGAFSVGGLTDSTSSQFAATIPAAINVLELLAIIVLLLVLLACVGAFRARLGGTLILTSVDDVSGELALPAQWWRRSASTEDLIGIPGRITVRGSPISRLMRIGLQLAGRPKSSTELAPGGRTMTAGIYIIHDPARTYGDRSGYEGRWDDAPES